MHVFGCDLALAEVDDSLDGVGIRLAGTDLDAHHSAARIDALNADALGKFCQAQTLRQSPISQTHDREIAGMATQLSRKIVADPVISTVADLAIIGYMTDLAQKYEHFKRRFVEALDAREYTREGFAEVIEAHPVTIGKLRTGALRLDDAWRNKVASALNLPEDLLFGDAPLPKPRDFEMYRSPKRRGRPATFNRVLPHYGLAAGSIAGATAISGDLPDEVPCPPGLRDVLGAYALTTTGESMIPRFFPGERLYVNPNQRVHTGDFVVIQTAKDDGPEIETWVKRFDAEDKGAVWVSQYNPHARIEFKKKFVRYMHRIMPINELF